MTTSRSFFFLQKENPSRRLGFDLFRVRRASQFPRDTYRCIWVLDARAYVLMFLCAGLGQLIELIGS